MVWLLYDVMFVQVTSLLLEAERRKLNVLQRDLQSALAEGGSIKAKEHQKQELIIAISWVPSFWISTVRCGLESIFRDNILHTRPRRKFKRKCCDREVFVSLKTPFRFFTNQFLGVWVKTLTFCMKFYDDNGDFRQNYVSIRHINSFSSCHKTTCISYFIGILKLVTAGP